MDSIVALVTGLCGGMLLAVLAFQLAYKSIQKGDTRARRMRSHKEV